MYRAVRSTCEEYNLLSAGDRILVAMSGGKDSYTLFHLLTKLVPRLPFKVELVAVHLDQVQPGYDGAGLRRWLEATGWPFEILREDTYSVVTEHIDDKSTYCSLCSRLRRGIIYKVAGELGANKIALGHHRDDMVETLFLNMFFGGKLKAMPPKLVTDKGDHVVIRPLAYCAEKDIARYARGMEFPIIPCNLCGSQENLQRQAIKQMLHEWERQHPGRTQTIFTAMQNVKPSHLLDTTLFDFVNLKLGDAVGEGDVAFDQEG